MIRIDALNHHFTPDETDATGMTDPHALWQCQLKEAHNQATAVMAGLTLQIDQVYGDREAALDRHGPQSPQYETAANTVFAFEQRYVQTCEAIITTNEPITPAVDDHRVIADEGWWLIPHEVSVTQGAVLGFSLETVIRRRTDTCLPIGRNPAFDAIYQNDHR